MNVERIDDSLQFDGEARFNHEYRYKIAGQYTKDDDTVLDMACGTGYGAKFLKGKYIGVDKIELCGNIVADLNNWKPDFDFDVGISFETIEHLRDYKEFLETLKKAKRLIIYSAPITPTKDRNEFHLHDFTYEELRRFFLGWGKIVYEERQKHSKVPEGFVGIFVIRKYD